MATRSIPGLVVIGVGGIGLAVARRLGAGHLVILADWSKERLDVAANSLRDEGHQVETQTVDVSDYQSVKDLAKFASAAASLKTVVTTAGISISMGTARKIYEVNLLGTANVIDAFLEVMPPGSSFTSVASAAGYLQRKKSPELEKHLATAPREQLLSHEEIDLEGSCGSAYAISKLGNIVRVQGSVVEGGKKGVRLNTISPGWIASPMMRIELQAGTAERYKVLTEHNPIPRVGSADEVASLVAFLAGPDAGFIHGSDFVIDGGYLAAHRFPSQT